MKQIKVLLMRKASDVVAFTTTKPSDMSPGQYTGRIRGILRELKAGADVKCFAKQVHGAKVLVPRSPAFVNFREADGFVTDKKGYLLTIFTADCLPVLFYDKKSESIGAVHCGWKSTYKGIAEKAVRKMKKLYGAKPRDIKVFFGPPFRTAVTK